MRTAYFSISGLLKGLFATILSFALSAHAALVVVGSPVVTYLHNDALGNPIAATNAAGTVLWQERYRPFGEPLRKTNTTGLGFQDKPVDSDTGLSYFGARYYDPVLGRFISIDPVGFGEDNPFSFNRYAYGNNNPYKYNDPDGRNPLAIGLAVVDVGLMVWDAHRAYQEGGTAAAMKSVVTNLAINAVTAGTGVAIKVGARYLREGSEAVQVAKSVVPNAEQAENLKRFGKKIPSNSKDSVNLRELPNDGVAAQATSPGRVQGSKAVYEKQIDVNGKTIQSTKTTYDPQGDIVHVKDKLNGGTYP